MYDEMAVTQFYDQYGEKEWNRLEQDAYGRLLYELHMDFMKPYIRKGGKVLDVGCGGGRFGIYAAQKGSRVTLLDLSQVQLDIARKKCKEAKAAKQVDDYVCSSVTDMSCLPDNTFDTVICYGAVLNYLHEQTEKALMELIRVTKSGGELLISVNSKCGVLRACASQLDFPLCDFWGKPGVWGIQEMISTGNEMDYPGAKHPLRHFFSAQEMMSLLSRRTLARPAVAAAPAIITGLRDNAETLCADSAAWETMLEMEKKLYQNESLADCGEFILAKATVMK